MENKICCKQCNSINDIKNQFCEVCGTSLRDNQAELEVTNEKSIIDKELSLRDLRSGSIYCPKCGCKNSFIEAPLTQTNFFCQRCDKRLNEIWDDAIQRNNNLVKCSNCSKITIKNMKYCINCGEELKRMQKQITYSRGNRLVREFDKDLLILIFFPYIYYFTRGFKSPLTKYIPREKQNKKLWIFCICSLIISILSMSLLITFAILDFTNSSLIIEIFGYFFVTIFPISLVLMIVSFIALVIHIRRLIKQL